MKKSAKNAKQSNTQIAIPKGYTVCASGGMTAAVDWEKTPIVEGEVLEIKSITKTYTDKKTKKKTKSTTRLMIVKLKDKSEVAVWEKKQLETLFDSVDEGSYVFIQHTGMLAVKGRALPMHEFRTAFK